MFVHFILSSVIDSILIWLYITFEPVAVVLKEPEILMSF